MMRCMVQREGHIPPWLQVRDALRAKILSGELPPGAMVPSIVTLHQEYGIAKTTARKVLAALRDEGLIVTTPGWGSFVVERPALSPPPVQSGSQGIAPQSTATAVGQDCRPGAVGEVVQQRQVGRGGLRPGEFRRFDPGRIG